MSVQAGRHEAVEARSVELRKELSVLDLAFAQILFIVGLQWVGVAARQGPSHVVFWLVAILLFYVPSAIVAVWLNRAMPLEGGLYQWVKLGFNDAVGFIVGWNLWLFAILNMTNVGLQFTQYLGYIFGARVEAFVGQAWVTAAMSAIVTGALVWITLAGLRIGKWVHTAGGILMLAMFATIIALPWLNVASGSLAEYHPLQTATPVISLLSLNLLGKMGFGAFAGFEYVAIHAGECRNPVRSITRATLIAAPITIVMFVFGTSSVVAMIPFDDIDLIAPIPQLLSVGFVPLGATAGIVPVILLPIIPVGSRTVFAMKIVGLIVVTNVIGAVLYFSGRRRLGNRRD